MQQKPQFNDILDLAEASGLRVESADFPSKPDIRWFVTDCGSFFENCRDEEELMRAVTEYQAVLSHG